MKSIIITGASGGIGYEFAKKIAPAFDYVAICGYSNENALKELKGLIEQNGHTACDFFTGDISDYSFVSDMVETVMDKAHEISVLVNTAAISQIGLFTDTSLDDWNKIVAVNLNSIYNTCHQVVPYMVHNKSGKIINISSVWGLVGASCEVAYSATKGAINSFSRALAKELAPSNISVNAVAFGAIDTKMNGHLSDEEKELLNEEIPYGRMATPEEAASFLENILNMPAYFTGEVVKFDGAWI